MNENRVVSFKHSVETRFLVLVNCAKIPLVHVVHFLNNTSIMPYPMKDLVRKKHFWKLIKLERPLKSMKLLIYYRKNFYNMPVTSHINVNVIPINKSALLDIINDSMTFIFFSHTISHIYHAG